MAQLISLIRLIIMNSIDNSNKFFINDIITNLEKIGNEKKKDEFIKNYSNLKNQIEETDKLLSDNEETKVLEEEYKSQNINELFNILEENSDFILNHEKLETFKLKKLLMISKILEDKINNENINIFENK